MPEKRTLSLEGGEVMEITATENHIILSIQVGIPTETIEMKIWLTPKAAWKLQRILGHWRLCRTLPTT